MRLKLNLMKLMVFFRTEDQPTGYVGTEKKAVEYGVFPVQITSLRQDAAPDHAGLERKSDAEFLFSPSLPIKVGDGFCLSGSKPQYRITEIESAHIGFCKGKAMLWK